tara:strand:- start:53 stop:265 length:213 start_codon:yes stop_codon:yes gene_type:complete
MSCNKKKLNIGNNNVVAKIKICKSLCMKFDKLSVGINPPEDIVVKARLKASSSLMSTRLYIKITKIVEKI